MRTDIEDARKKLEPDVPVRARRRGRGEAGEPAARAFAAIRTTSATKCRGTSSACCRTASRSRSRKGSGRLELADAILKQPHRDARDRQPHLEGPLRHRHRRHAEQLRHAGERPTNPELLEYLASTFVEERLSIKKLHREIMLSAVYQLGSDERRSQLREGLRQPLSTGAPNRKRMDAEQLRDSVLLVSGALDTAMGGPSRS